jgi:hypothetical protein
MLTRGEMMTLQDENSSVSQRFSLLLYSTANQQVECQQATY